MFQRFCSFCMIFRTEKSPDYLYSSIKSWCIPAGIPPRREKLALMRKGPGFLYLFERYPMERKLLWTGLPQVTKCVWKVQQSKMKCNIAVAISNWMHPTHSFLTSHSHLSWPHSIFGRTKNRQEADFQSQGRNIRLARGPHLPHNYHQQTIPATALLCSGRKTGSGLSYNKHLLPLQTKEYVLFHLAQKWLLEVRDNSFVKLPINKTVFTDVQMAAQRHRATFAAPTPSPITAMKGKHKLPQAATEAEAKTPQQRATLGIGCRKD